MKPEYVRAIYAIIPLSTFAAIAVGAIAHSRRQKRLMKKRACKFVPRAQITFADITAANWPKGVSNECGSINVKLIPLIYRVADLQKADLLHYIPSDVDLGAFKFGREAYIYFIFSECVHRHITMYTQQVSQARYFSRWSLNKRKKKQPESFVELQPDGSWKNHRPELFEKAGVHDPTKPSKVRVRSDIHRPRPLLTMLG